MCISNAILILIIITISYLFYQLICIHDFIFVHCSTDNEMTGYASGAFDELAIWTRRLSDKDKELFLGGYSKFVIVYKKS